ncbi:MAG: hypothetical protein BYD32DRAFT_450299 [Podila humilis]|nr:MAG: hypothetical protein BYD32DRAFT_450299 [Podila humilis]
MARLLFSCLLATLITLVNANVSNTDQHPLAKPAPHKKFYLIWGNYPLKENQPFRLMAQLERAPDVVLRIRLQPDEHCIISSEGQECSCDTWLDCVEEWAEYRIRLESPMKSYLKVVDNQRLFFTVDNYQSLVQLLPITAALDQEKASNYFYLITE